MLSFISTDIGALWMTGWIFTLLLMSFVWLLYKYLRNAGVVDIFWAFGFSGLAGVYFYFGDGWIPRKILLAAMVILASVRLTWYLYTRFRHEHPVEDPRYTSMRGMWGAQDDVLFLVIYWFQGAVMSLISLPFVFAMSNTTVGFSGWDVMGAVIWLLGFVGEAVADTQLSHFKKDPANHGKTCRTGLWSVSRHPNYFCEWLMWVGYFVVSFSIPAAITSAWWGVFSPLLMLLLLTKFTGIAATEARAIQSRSDYADYQKTTSPFIPWFPKHSMSALERPDLER
ncbi:MAG: DUF1295 domain-containing protein [Cyanobacteria bacterium]|nr:DUF1295 domain-containing protein [Cyanobacteriota bacterium]